MTGKSITLALIGFLFCCCHTNAQDSVVQILQEHCGNCHLGEEARGSFRLDGLDRSGFEAIRGEVLHRIASEEDGYRMPPSGTGLSVSEQQSLRKWLPDGHAERAFAKSSIGNRFQDHWATKPLPEIKKRAIDVEVARYARSYGRRLTEPLNRGKLLRRLSYDLRGLPPTPAELQEFMHDPRTNAYRIWVDRWLASPEFANHWATSWLDLARYADSDGSYRDEPRRDAHRYRDWVIQSINRDQPIDGFSRDQLAGDLLAGRSWDQLVAASFHRNTPINRDACADPVEERFNRLVDRVNTTAVIWLGLTLQCAQCHDHKLEPISTRQYYELLAVFADAKEVDAYIDAERAAELHASLEQLGQDIERRRQEIEMEVANSRHRAPAMTTRRAQSLDLTWILLLTVLWLGMVGLLRFLQSPRQTARLCFVGGGLVLAGALVHCFLARPVVEPNDSVARSISDRTKIAIGSDHLRQEMLARRLAVQAELGEIPKVASFRMEPRQSHVHLRGQFSSLGAVVEPRIPNWLGVMRGVVKDVRATRLDLVDWLFHSRNTLTPRVFANRIASRLFARPLAGEVDNLGISSEGSDWKELVDQLAAKLVEGDWSRKSLVREIVLSRSYRARCAETDKEFSMVRSRELTAEELRDTCLALSRQLERTVIGSGNAPEVSENWRTVLQTRTRQNLTPLAMAFSAPSREECCVQRSEGNGVIQALAMMNDPIVIEASNRIGGAMFNSGLSDSQCLRRVYLLCLSRYPDAREESLALDWLDEMRPTLGERAVWVALARALMGHDEALRR